MDPIRLDRLLVDRGLVPSRPRAERLITDHGVRVDGVEVRKPGKKVSPDAQPSTCSVKTCPGCPEAP